MTTSPAEPTIILIPGHWLGAWAWEDVVAALTETGLRAVPMTLPGLDHTDPDRASVTLEDQAAAIERMLSSIAGPAVIAAHSGANAPVSLVLDRDPARVRRVIWVDSGPVAPGAVFAPDAPSELPLPSFEALGAQASLDGLSPETLERFRRLAVAEPGPVLRAAAELTDDARRGVPTTMVCCSITSEQVRALAEAGHPMFAEVAELDDCGFVDLPTGHWPMWSRPVDLAGVIAAAVARDG